MKQIHLSGRAKIFAHLLVFFLALPAVLANTYVVDIGFVTSQTVYTVNETIELKGNLYISNYSDNGTLLSNHTGLANATVNISVTNKNTNANGTSYILNTTTGGVFYSRSDFYPSAVLIQAPSVAADYYIKANYTDTNGTAWWTQSEIQVVNQSVDRLEVSPDKVSYSPSESMVILVEAVSAIGDRITYTANVSVNGTIRNSSKSILATFNCTTSSAGKCTANATTPGSYGDYFIEVNNFKAFSSFTVKRFDVGIEMKDELGKSIKHTFNTGEQASVDITVLTNSTTETYTFSGVIRNSAGTDVKTITSTVLNSTNSYANRFTFTLDALTFPVGTYFVEVNVTKTGDGTVSVSTSFEVKSWDLILKKREVASGFEYEHSAFPNRTINLEVYPTWRGNGSIIDSINTTTSMNISLLDKMSNQLATSNASWNATCGKEGCYNFSLPTPSNAGGYFVSVSVSFSGATLVARKTINVVSASIFAQSTDKDGSLKDLFNANDFAYISLSAKNSTSDINLTNASVVSVAYMNGTEYSYAQVGDFGAVNSTNTPLEWAWNVSSQRLKLDTPSAGGVYTAYITAQNNTAAATARFIVNPYDVCLVAKNTPGQAGSGTGYYYVYQFKVSDTIYFELKVIQANNPLGRAASMNVSNASYGMGNACTDLSSTRQVVNNATVTVDEVTNMQTGKKFTLNSSASVCQADDTKGGYTCTVKPLGSWDGGSYGVKLKITGQNGQTDIAYAGFEARAFYLYAWPSNWQNKPSGNVALNVYMYEAGDNWWGSYGSGGLSGTVKLEKVEYQGRPGEWLSPPIEYGYNVSKVNTSTITNGQGTITLSPNHTTEGQWKTGSYRAVLKGTDNGGTTDYGYAWFNIKQWEVYASPVECSSGSCTSTYNINSKSNVSLYVSIFNAGEWGQSGNSFGGNISIRVKKIEDCRKWPCSELNASAYNSTAINVSRSSGWYWSGSINTSYIINITPNTGSWGTGYWQVTLDANGTETGSGWFNTIAFYTEAQPTDSTGNTWKSNIKNNEPMYFKVTTAKSQKGGYYYASYNTSDHLNTTIDSAYLSRWDEVTYQQVKYTYNSSFNISIVGGGTIINGTRMVNVTFNNGSWPSGYYWGELALRNSENETATAWLWFSAKPFRVQVNSNQYSIDNTACVNGTIYIYNPDWSSSNILNGTYNITGVTERTWSASGSSMVTYTNYTPSASFSGNSSFTVCPNSAKWGSGSWGNYHYLTIRIQDNESNAENGWLSFRTIPFSVTWGSVRGGTNVAKSNNTVVPVNLTKSSSGALTAGNLSRIYQWRYDNRRNTREEYVFSVGSCYSNVSATCMVNGTANVTIYAPSGGWKDGSNYLQAEWIEHDDSSSRVEDYSGVWFNGIDVYTGWFNNADENGNYKYYFASNDNLTIRLYVRDSSNNAASVNITRVQYSTPSTSCWDEYCRTYTDAAYSIVGRSNTTINDNGIIKIPVTTNWSRGQMYVKATVSGSGGSSTIKNGGVYVRDSTAPTVTIAIPAINTTITSSSYWINWTTTEAATCWLNINSYGNYQSWYCGNWNATNSTNATTPNPYWVDSCNMTKYGFSGTSYYTEYISSTYRSWNYGSGYGWNSYTTGMSTGGTSHYYQSSTDNMPAQSYGITINCNDEDWNYGYGYASIRVNVSSSNQNLTNVTLVSPANNATLTNSSVTFNYSFTGPATANCTLYGNFTGSWASNTTSNNLSAGSNSFNVNLTAGNRYLWNVYCVDATNATNTDWGDANWTLIINSTQTNVTLVSPANNTNLSNASVVFNYSFTGPTAANCSLYGNFSGTWASNQTTNNIARGSGSFNLNLTNGTYVWNVYCVDSTNSTNTDWGDSNRTFTLNNATNSSQMNVTLVYPANGSIINSSLVTFNFTWSGPSSANCSLYGNVTGTWALNTTQNNIASGTRNFSSPWRNGRYLWNVYCVETTDGTNSAWGASNWTFVNNNTGN